MPDRRRRYKLISIFTTLTVQLAAAASDAAGKTLQVEGVGGEGI